MRGRVFPLLLLFSAMMLVLSACGSSGSHAQGQMDNSSKPKTEQTTSQDNGKSSDMTKEDKSSDQNKDSNKNDNKNMKMSNQTDNQSNQMSDQSDQKNAGNQSAQKNDHVLNVTAHNFAFNKDKFVVKSGKITIHFKSVQGTHGFALYKSPSSTKKLVNIVGKGTKTVKLSPGKYYIHCSVVCGKGHGQMDAVLIVKK